MKVLFYLLIMDIYSLSRNYWNFAFDNPEKITPTHTAIYFFAIEHCNRLWGKEKFWFPSQMTMEAIGVNKHQTYIKYFNDLVEWWFIKLIEKSKNQYSSNIISLIYAMPKKDKALDKALIKHTAKQGAKQGTYNNNNIQTNKETNIQYFSSEKLNNIFLDFIKLRKEIKKPITKIWIEQNIKKINKLLLIYNEDEVIWFIENSIENWYQWIFEKKQNNFSKETKKLSYENTDSRTNFKF